MDATVHYAASVLLRDRTRALIGTGGEAVVGIFRRPRKALLRDLTALDEFLAARGESEDLVTLFPEAAQRIRSGRLAETVTGLIAIAYLGDAHVDNDDSPRAGTAVFVDGKVAHLTWSAEHGEAHWRLFEDGTQACDWYMLGLAMILTALTGKPGRIGGAA
jgi:hypothetical protein